jgi:hypothetical protein
MLLFKFIYCYILIFKVKSLKFSIQKWKLFEMKINIMILNKILFSFIVEKRIRYSRINIDLFRISNAFLFKNKKR